MNESSVENDQNSSPAPQQEESSWWSSAWNTLKSTAEKVVEVYKEDLKEFAGGVATDTGKVVQDVKEADIVNKAIAKSEDLVAHVVEVISSANDSSHDVSVSSSHSHSRLESKLLDLQRDMGTYCTDPPDANAFAEYCSSLQLSSLDRQLVVLLSTSLPLQTHYTRLVPHIVPYDTFWYRYLFREHRLREREEERRQLIARAAQTAASGAGDTGDDEFLPWDDDGDNEISSVTPTTTATPGKKSAIFETSFASPLGKGDLLSEGWDDEEEVEVEVTVVETPKEKVVSPDVNSKSSVLSDVSVVVGTGQPAVLEDLEEPPPELQRSDVVRKTDSVTVVEDWVGWE